MRKYALYLLPLAALAMLATPVQADPLDKEHMVGFKVPLKIGLNLNVASAGSSELRFTLGAGAGVEFFFVPNVGVFAGLDYMNRGFKLTTTAAGAGYIDIPFGIAFQYRGGFGGDALNTVKLGGYAAVPLEGTFAGTIAGAGSSSTYFGIMLESSMLFPISDAFALGMTTWVKYGLGAGSTAFNAKFFDVGFGLGARFF